MNLFRQQQGSIYRAHNNGIWKWLRRKKHRVERRRAKHNPDCVPAYNRFMGYWD